MKKSYNTPELNVVPVINEDICTISANNGETEGLVFGWNDDGWISH